MLHVDIPTRDELRALLEQRDPISVTLYLPTTPLTQDTDATRIALKNMAREAEHQLAHADKRRVAALLEQIDDVMDDDAFWRVQAHSLALMVTPDRLVSFRLPNALQPMVGVSDRFHLKPLLRAVTFPQVAYVLALSAGGVRLLEVTADLPTAEVKVEAMPRDAASAAGKASIKDRSHSSRLVGSEGEKVRLRQYARQVDAALRPLLQGSEIPLILAASETLGALYRSINSYPHLAEAGITESADTLDAASLGAKARAVLDGLHAAQIATWNELFAQRREQSRGLTDIATTARAAVRGAVDSALVDIDVVMPGQVDPQTGAIEMAAADDATAYGVIDEIARQIILAGGKVFAVRQADISGGHPIAAILRYAL